jgi:hypothetical protein
MLAAYAIAAHEMLTCPELHRWKCELAKRKLPVQTVSISSQSKTFSRMMCSSWRLTQAGPQEFAPSLCLLLLYPILEAESRKHHCISETTSAMLVTFLERFEPLSLRVPLQAHGLISQAEPADYLDGLEQLLLNWLSEKEFTSKESAVVALISLACAR